MRQINDAGLAKLKSLEGFVGYAYDDADPYTPKKRVYDSRKVRGTLTIGYGATLGVKAGDAMTEEQASQRLLTDLRPYCEAVERLVKVELTDNQFAALVIFAYNVGLGKDGFDGSTLLKLLNKGDYASVPKELMKWVKTTINGKKVVSEGLVNRRSAEAGLWALGAYAHGSNTPAEPVKKKIITPESIAMATTAATGIGSSGLVDGNGPFQYALAAIAVIAFCVGVYLFLKKRL